MGKLLDKAGEERFCFHAEQFRAELEILQADQVLCKGIMVALGYAKNKQPFRQLAHRLPLSVLPGLVDEQGGQSLLTTIRALLFGIAGLLPGQRLTPNLTLMNKPSRYTIVIPVGEELENPPYGEAD